jgi:adenosine kinase
LKEGVRVRIVVTGSIAYDYLMVFPGHFKDHILPDKVHVLSVSFLVESMRRQRGGTAPNIAYNLALLGEHPAVMGTVGEDFAEYRLWLEEQGIDTGAIKPIPDEFTSSCFINTDLQDNQITAFYPGAMAHAATLSLKASNLQDADLVIIACRICTILRCRRRA